MSVLSSSLCCPVGVWPRLQSSQERPHWLRVDFDHWEELSDGEGEEEVGEEDKKPLTREKLGEIKEKQVCLQVTGISAFYSTYSRLE